MTVESVRADLASRAPDLSVIVTEDTTATVQTAAAVHGCAPGQIAKTLADLRETKLIRKETLYLNHLQLVYHPRANDWVVDVLDQDAAE